MFGELSRNYGFIGVASQQLKIEADVSHSVLTGVLTVFGICMESKIENGEAILCLLTRLHSPGALAGGTNGERPRAATREQNKKRVFVTISQASKPSTT